MERKEIFQSITSHMLQGIMLHEQLATYFDFLNLQWYRKCQEKRHFEETYAYRCLSSYYINHYNELIPELEVKVQNFIPQKWYEHNRYDVDPSTKKNAIKNGFELWVQWERDTKAFYEEMYEALLSIADVAGAEKVRELIVDVDEELKEAEQELLNLIAINYDLTVVVPDQHDEPVKIKFEFY